MGFFRKRKLVHYSKNILIRKDYYPPSHSDYYLLGRQRQDGTSTAVKIGNYQVPQLADYIKMILHQYFECMGKNGKYTTIPCFEGKERTFPWKGNRLAFWNTCDLDLGSLSVALTVNQTNREPELILNNPVKANITQRYGGTWAGLSLALSIEGLINLEAFFREVGGDYGYSPLHQDTGTPPPTPSPTVSPIKPSLDS
ncbi:unnamed protein product [Allacma fusca]|uniref:Uncharacterized protein n=1 Tax=Allacma fusca TaxID=39272 RepID=A0A8J2L0I4_9HEXA|nr:unnamed protein product [Allacma fusca]